MNRQAVTISMMVMLGCSAARARDFGVPTERCHSRIRSQHRVVEEILVSAALESPSFARIMAHIEASDVIAYVMLERPRTPAAAHVSFMSAVGGRRYVRVSIDPRHSGLPLIAILAHELQHVAEIAGARHIVDERTLAAFYDAVGFRTDTDGRRFETSEAIEAGRRVADEVFASRLSGHRLDDHRHRIDQKSFGHAACVESRAGVEAASMISVARSYRGRWP